MAFDRHQTQSHDDVLVSHGEVVKMLAARVEKEVQGVEEEAKRWEKEIQRIDPTLEIVFVGEAAEMTEHIVPGRYHLRKQIPGTIPEYMALVGPNGEFRIPGSWLLDGGPESLQAADMWNPRVHRHKKEVREKVRGARERTRKLIAEQRKDEVEVAVRAAKRVRSNAGMETTFEAKRKGEGIKKP